MPNEYSSIRRTIGSVPSNWTWAPLGSLLTETNLRAEEVPHGSDLPVLSLTKERGLIPQSDRFNHRIATSDVSNYKVVQPGWITYNPMVIWEGAVWGLHGESPGLVSPVYVTWETKDADWEFLDLMLRTPMVLSEYERLCAGVVKRRRVLKKDQFKSIEIPLPPLGEQRVIARALRGVQRAKEATEQVIAAARQLKKSMRQHLFTHGHGDLAVDRVEAEFGSVPAHWEITPLSRTASIQTGVAKGRRLESHEVIEVPYLRVANVQDGYLDLREIKTIRLKAAELERFALRKGDILLTEGGDFDKLGRGFIWQGQLDPCVHQNHIFVVRPDPNHALPEYISYLVQSPHAKRYFLKVAHRTTNLASINKTKLGQFPTLLAPLGEQRSIVHALARVDQKLAAELALHDALAVLFGSLLRNLMTAQVRVKETEATT